MLTALRKVPALIAAVAIHYILALSFATCVLMVEVPERSLGTLTFIEPHGDLPISSPKGCNAQIAIKIRLTGSGQIRVRKSISPCSPAYGNIQTRIWNNAL
jgi:hypothetical protein